MVDVPFVQQVALQCRETFVRDAPFARQFEDGVVDGEDRAGRADDRVPPPRPVDRFEHLKFLAGGVLGVPEPMFQELAVAEERLGHRHAAHVEAFHQVGLELSAEDEFRAAAADVHHQTGFGTVFDGFEGVRDAEVDQARLLPAADDLDAMLQRAFGRLDEVLAVARLAQGVGANDADVARGKVADALAQAFEAGDGAGGNRRGQGVVHLQPFRESHHLLVPIHDLQAVAVVVGDDEVETVGAQVERGVGLFGFPACRGDVVMLRHGGHSTGRGPLRGAVKPAIIRLP